MPGSLWFRFRVPRPPRLLRVRRSAPDLCRGHSSGLGLLFNRCPSCRCFPFVDASGISRVSWPSIPCLCPALRPRPDRPDLAICGPVSAAPGYRQTEDSSVNLISRLNPGLWHPLPTLHEPRCRCPCKARFRLAGCAFAGRVSNPQDRFERFQSTSILLSRTFHDASRI